MEFPDGGLAVQSSVLSLLWRGFWSLAQELLAQGMAKKDPQNTDVIFIIIF